MNIDNFIKETIGKGYDIDKAYGIQCVDGFKKFTQDAYNESNFTCGNGWAYGLWTCYGKNGVEKYYNKHPFSEARKGDWIIWNKGSKQAPNSHVGMFIEKVGNDKVKVYGQNQAGIKEFNYCTVSIDGILGVLRLKINENTEYHKGDSSNVIEKVDEYLSEKVKGNYFGDYTEACLRVFKLKNGLPDDSIIDNNVLDKMGIK